jgi:hypothetical protein
MYPSHRLIELDLNDDKTSSELLSILFRATHDDKHHRDKGDKQKSSAFQRTNINPDVAKTSSKHLGPISLPTKYHQMWNYTTNTIHIDAKDRFDNGPPKTSLEILQEIMTDDHGYDDDEKPSCFSADTTNHDDIVSLPLSQSLQFPLLNMGLPMDPWNDAVRDFFNCIGLSVIHQKRKGKGSVGKKLLEAVHANMMPLTAYFGDEVDVYTHLDYTATLDSSQGLVPGVEKSSFPQIQLLDEIHQNFPNATWLLPFPKFDDWVDWAQGFHNFTERWARMEMPGLVLTPEQRRDRQTPCELDGEGVGRCKRLSDGQLKDWWSNHVRHIRRVVNDAYPSHTLIEIDLFDRGSTSKILKHLFRANETCLSMIYEI